MARSGARSAPKTENTQDRVLAAAIETLKRQGYAGTSAREIAKTGGFAEGVVFYYFGGMTELLVAALDATSREAGWRVYEAAVADVGSLPELVAVASAVFREDLAAGHVKVLSELIAAACPTSRSSVPRSPRASARGSTSRRRRSRACSAAPRSASSCRRATQRSASSRCISASSS